MASEEITPENANSENDSSHHWNQYRTTNNFNKIDSHQRGRTSRGRRPFYPRSSQQRRVQQSYHNFPRVNLGFAHSQTENDLAFNTYSSNAVNDISVNEYSHLSLPVNNGFAGTVPKQRSKRNGNNNCDNSVENGNNIYKSEGSNQPNIRNLKKNVRRNFRYVRGYSSGRGQREKLFHETNRMQNNTFHPIGQQNLVTNADIKFSHSAVDSHPGWNATQLDLDLNFPSTPEEVARASPRAQNYSERPFNKKRIYGEKTSNNKTNIKRDNYSNFHGFVKDFRKSPNYSNEQHSQKTKVKNEAISQRDRLIEQLTKNAYECMVCCDRVKTKDPIWNCQNCFHIFHLRCIRKWAQSSTASVEESGWRCPACQHITEKIPNRYFCFCGKLQDPGWNYYETPHSCGELCGKQRSNKNCIHRCNILCHPGPCPPCQVQIKKKCECGKTSQLVLCDHSSPILCDNICGKPLNCGIHFCQRKCHENCCDPCQEIILLTCHCGKESKEVLCNESNAGQVHFPCGSVCDRLLSCGNHYCKSLCHPGDCEPCKLTPDLITTCPCGQTSLSELMDKERNSCLDPISCCGKICNKILSCGPTDNPHRCRELCHEDNCPPCPLKMTVKCNCGFQSQEIECVNSSAEILCSKRCNKKLHCGRHKCLKNCCTDQIHACEQICKRKLSCGLHTCEEPCHRGNCLPCWHTSFEELSCHCGNSVLYPPIACGTKPPECNQLCARVHSCTHPITHQCHSDEKCPPCTFLTEKWCYGKHELRCNVPCYLNEISCGLPCGKLLPCGKHHCQQICHPGECLSSKEKCKQPCTVPRPQCGHPCNAPCHPNKPCPVTPCKTKVQVTCHCGHLVENITCTENLQMIQQNITSAVASKLSDLNAGQTVDIRDLYKSSDIKNKRRLECNSECALIDRNRRLALALQIRNPELTNKLGPPSYTDFLKDHMKQNPQLVTTIYNKLAELVQNAKQSKQKSRSYAFAPMNREHRRIIHELAEFFGCETCSYDEEPKKNVVATAFRDKSWLPSISLMTVVERESLPRKAPPPIPHHKSQVTSPRSEPLENIQNGAAKPLEPVQPTQSKQFIDYFDYDPASK